MISCKIDDKNVKVTLKGTENNGKNMSRAMRTIAVELEEFVREKFEVGVVIVLQDLCWEATTNGLKVNTAVRL